MFKKSFLSCAVIALLLVGCTRDSLNFMRVHHYIDFDWKFSRADKWFIARYIVYSVVQGIMQTDIRSPDKKETLT